MLGSYNSGVVFICHLYTKCFNIDLLKGFFCTVGEVCISSMGAISQLQNKLGC